MTMYFKSNEKTYSLFDVAVDMEPLGEAKFLALVQYGHEGEISEEKWWLENDEEAVRELQRYYRDLGYSSPRVHLFKLYATKD